MSVNGSDIEKAAELALTDSGKFLKVQIGKPIPNIARPGVSVAVVDGTFERVGNRLRRNIKITILIVVKNITSESERRIAIHPLLDYVTRLFWDSSLGLEIDGITPTNWTETSTPQQVIDGLLVFQHEFTTKSVFSKEPTEQEQIALDEIWATYTIQPGDSEADASDSVELKEP